MSGIRRYYKIWMPLLSIVLFFSAAEFICRAFNLTDTLDADFKFYIRNVDNDIEQENMVEDALLMWFPRANYTFNNVKIINSQGFRDKEYNVKKDKDVFRILCLGDSSTFGWNVPLEETYHALLETRLNKEFGHQGKRFEIINAGVTGYTSCQGLNLYKFKGVKYEPDVVTFYLGVNDPVKRFYLNDKQIMRNDVPVWIKSVNNNLLLQFHSYRLLREWIVHAISVEKNHAGENIPRVSPEDFKKNILELNGLCNRNGALLVLISPPLCKERDFGGDVQRKKDVVLYRKELESISRENKIPLIKIVEMTEEASSDTTPFFLDAVHPNTSGHRMIEERLYHYLRSNRLLDSP